MFYKKKKIEPQIDSIIGYMNHRHWSDQTGKSSKTFYARKKSGKIKEIYYPIYKGETHVGWRKLYFEPKDEIL